MRLLVPLLLAGLWPLAVERVVDGDTFVGWVELRPGLLERHTVRLYCLDAPELREDGGRQARDELAAYLDGGVMLWTDWRRDKYGRTLGVPWRGDGGYCPR